MSNGRMKLQRSSGVVLHPTSLPERRLGRATRTRSSTGCGGRTELVADTPARAARRVRLAVRSPPRSRPGTASSPSRTRRSPREEPRPSVARNAFWIEDWAASRARSVADQVRFDREWSALRTYAAERGVRLIGDVPIYVAPAASTTRRTPISSSPGSSPGSRPTGSARRASSGATRSTTGTLRRDGYRWWIERFRRTLELVDLIRVDHFRGFVAYWAVPGASTRRRVEGRWRRGPGAELLRRGAKAARAGCRSIAEDLGVITPAVERCATVRPAGHARPAVRASTPGGRTASCRKPRASTGGLHRHARQRHDARLVGDAAPRAEPPGRPASPRRRAELDPDPARARPRRATRVVPVQDVLGLGTEARLNTPGKAEGNWNWRPARPADARARRAAARADEARTVMPGEGTRTPTSRRTPGFKPDASANSATPASDEV